MQWKPPGSMIRRVLPTQAERTLRALDGPSVSCSRSFASVERGFGLRGELSSPPWRVGLAESAVLLRGGLGVGSVDF